jgi:ribonucleoside-diphosphate reductase alpha chain
MTLTVTKRNGRKEPIDLNKIYRVITWAAEGLENVAVSQVVMKAHLQFFDGVTTFQSNFSISRGMVCNY